MPRTPEQFQEIREGKRQLILDVALELFASNGYHGTSISAIAKNAVISKGLLYNYFESKEELVIELMKSGFLNLVPNFGLNPDKIITKEELKLYIIDVMKTTSDKVHFRKLYFSVISQPIVNQVAFGEIMQIAMPFFEILTNFFIRSGIKNPEAEVRFFAAMLDGVTLNFVFDPENFPLEDSVIRILEIYNLNS